MKKWLPNWRLISVISVIALFLSGCGKPFLSTLQPAGEVAEMQYDLMILSAVIMVLVIVVVTVIFIFVLLRFKERKGEENKIPKQVEGSHKLEVIWTVIPIILLLILAVPVVKATFELADVTPMLEETRDENAVVVNVTANLYWWEFEYPDYGIITSQDLIVPTDERVYFNLIASDVKHSFWVPAVGGKMDTNTDNTNQFFLEFDSAKTEEAGGVFWGECAELCGPSHAKMDFKVKPLSRDDFDSWISKMQNATTPVASTDLAVQGEEIFNNSCLACHAVSPEDTRPFGARIAPNLATFGERETIAGVIDHNEENLRAWLEDPEQFKPGNKMSGTYGDLQPNDMDALVEYLMGLKVE
ncbi:MULTISPECIES: cytochrome c oxidase subunit II [Bacillaceae]|uniref:cytochrome c oxidase subunit II n=1 Tax=Bacillaceae TaxID=186817 RepID=UPI001BDE39DE|nr:MULTISPECIES: cytochrome c oxidase subunit II [Bacillaceae]MDX8359956.1 cytochrome c oxidase subunit II [Cytobacillus sp. IB215316]